MFFIYNYYGCNRFKVDFLRKKVNAEQNKAEQIANKNR